MDATWSLQIQMFQGVSYFTVTVAIYTHYVVYIFATTLCDVGSFVNQIKYDLEKDSGNEVPGGLVRQFQKYMEVFHVLP